VRHLPELFAFPEGKIAGHGPSLVNRAGPGGLSQFLALFNPNRRGWAIFCRIFAADRQGGHAQTVARNSRGLHKIRSEQSDLIPSPMGQT
jgi:hypothetical protein